MSDDNSLLQEIDDALRADKAHRFLQQYGKLILAGCGAIIVLTGISAYWKNHLHEQQMQQTHVMLEADNFAHENQYPEAIKQLDAMGPVATQHASLINLQKAKFYLKTGERDKAKALLQEVANSSAADEAVRGSALLNLQGLAPDADMAGADQTGHPFASELRQIKASHLIASGKKKEAGEILKMLLTETQPNSADHERVAELFQLTGESAAK